MITDKDKKIKNLEEEIEKLKKLISKDELTGALNRRCLNDKLEIIFKEALFLKGHPESKREFHIDNLSLIFIDIDDFKKTNDTYGHAVGDEVLKSFVKLIDSLVRDMDLLGRMGGEEFIIALVGATEDDAFRKAEEIRIKIAEENIIPDIKELNVTASLGVASVAKTNSKTIEDLISMADKAMYEAKNNRGKNNTVKYSEIG